MPKAKSQNKKTSPKKAKPKKPVNPIAKLLELKKAKLKEKSEGLPKSGTWSKSDQASHTWDHRFTKFAGPRRRAS